MCHLRDSGECRRLNAVFFPDGREFSFTRVIEGLDTMHQMTFIDGK